MNLNVSVKAEKLFSIGPLDVTNSFLTMVIVMALIILVGALIARRASVDRPGTAQSIFEMVAEFLLNLVESTAGKRVGRRVYPLVGALFFFIIIANYTGLLPGVGTVGWNETEPAESTTALVASSAQPGTDSVVPAQAKTEGTKVLVPFLRSPNADLNMTLAMAILTFVIVQVAGISAHGVAGRIKHMADPPFLFPIEAISELSRIISLSFRLFGNIFAGEVLVTVMFSLVAAIGNQTFYAGYLAAPVATVFLFLEVLFGFIQALVFALLALIYITLAAAGHDDHEEHGHGTVSAVSASAAAGD